MDKLTVHYNQRAATFMLRIVRSMVIGDALISKSWRLERIDPLVGFEYYILYCGDEVVGIQYVRARTWLSPVQECLAAYLSLIGFRPDTVELGRAKTRDSFEHNRQSPLFPSPVATKRPRVVTVGRGITLHKPPRVIVEKLRYASK